MSLDVSQLVAVADWQTVGVAVLAVHASLAVVYVAILGGRKLLEAFGGEDGRGMTDEEWDDYQRRQ